MGSNKISFATIYSECNNHLREMDKLRDQLISFFLVIVGAFFAIVESDRMEKFIVPISILLIFLSIFVSLTINEYRLWHTRYSYTAQLLVALSGGETKDYKKIEKATRTRAYQELHVNINKTSYRMTFDWIRHRYIKGTEFLTFTTSLIVAYIPFYSLLSSLFKIEFPVSFYYFGIYFLFFQLFSAQKLYSNFVRCPWAKWILHGISTNQDFTYDAEL